MARKLSVQYPGAIYHLLNRGGRHEARFPDDHDVGLDSRAVVKLLAQDCRAGNSRPA